MKLLSWNINGVRAIIKKGFVGFLKKEKPDYLCLQEIKISDEMRKKENITFPGYDTFWNSAIRPGYSGTATLVKSGLDAKEESSLSFDDEGRIQALDIGKFYLVNVYFPNANHELSRLDFKIDFNNKLIRYIKKLEKKKPIVICGDFNVAHNEIDLARPKENVGSPGFHPREREWMTKFINTGFIDTYRHAHPNKVQYTWWSYRANARANNVGWRIDYFCVSKSFVKKVKKTDIYDKVLGSDHCPVGIVV